ncbi:MAG: glycosyltransferase [Chthoniobacter sp.]
MQFIGFSDNVLAKMEELDIVVLASTTPEPFGQVLVEAMSLGKPVVATAGGGVPEVVIDGETGWLVPMGDATSMAERIVFLLENPDDARRMGECGKKIAVAKFFCDKDGRNDGSRLFGDAGGDVTQSGHTGRD